MNVSEKDWKLLRKYLPEWQETYMEKLVVECSVRWILELLSATLR